MLRQESQLNFRFAKNNIKFDKSRTFSVTDLLNLPKKRIRLLLFHLSPPLLLLLIETRLIQVISSRWDREIRKTSRTLDLIDWNWITLLLGCHFFQ